MNKQYSLRLGRIERRRKAWRRKQEAPSWHAPVPQSVPQTALQFPTGYLDYQKQSRADLLVSAHGLFGRMLAAK